MVKWEVKRVYWPDGTFAPDLEDYEPFAVARSENGQGAWLYLRKRGSPSEFAEADCEAAELMLSEAMQGREPIHIGPGVYGGRGD